jgi:hypothetical protein
MVVLGERRSLSSVGDGCAEIERISTTNPRDCAERTGKERRAPGKEN